MGGLIFTVVPSEFCAIETQFHSKTKTKIERRSPCSYFCTSVHPKIQWNWFTQHFHVPSWWVPCWVSSQNKDQSSIALCHCWGDRERCVLRVWMLWGSWFPFWKPRDLPLRSRTDSLSPLQVAEILYTWLTLGGWVNGESLGSPYNWMAELESVTGNQVGEQLLPLKSLLVRTSYYT